MKNFAFLLIAMAFAHAAAGGELVRTVSLSGQSADGITTVAADPQRPRQLLADITEPGIALPVYAIRGELRHEDVAGTAYLQMDNDFGEHGSYFSKTLAQSGPLAGISGSSDWRPFVLPFYADTGEVSMVPNRLTLSIYLPSSGSISLRNVAIYEYPSGEDPLRVQGQWFGTRAAAIGGAIGGSMIGLWGGLVGFLASRGRAKGFVLVSASALFVVGIASTVLGLTALLIGQPYAVYYPLLLIGVILTLIIGGLRHTLPRRYEALELKKMRAMDG